MLNHIDVVSSDVEAAVAFYRRLGVEISDDAVWRHKGRAHHVGITLPNGVELSLSSVELTKAYADGIEPSSILNTSVPSRDAVDALFDDLKGAGHPVVKEPFDAFWGARLRDGSRPRREHRGNHEPVRRRAHGRPRVRILDTRVT